MSFNSLHAGFGGFSITMTLIKKLTILPFAELNNETVLIITFLCKN